MKLPAKLRPFLGAGLLLACAGQPAPPANSRPSPTSPHDGPRLEDRAWGVLRSPALGLKLALPEARGWSEPGSTAPERSTWSLEHAATGSHLDLRRWRSSRLPRVDVCDTELRQRVPGLSPPDETNLVAEREVRVPQGFVTRITLLALPGSGAATPGSGARFRGQVIAVGAGVGECLAAVARTETTSEAELAERLRLLDVALGHLRLTHIEDRVPAPAPIPH